MAYMSQERKKELAPKIKEVLKKYNMKWTLSVNNYSTLVCRLKSGEIDFLEYLTDNQKERIEREWFTTYYRLWVNEYNIWSSYTGLAYDFLIELKSAMMEWNHNNSDAMTDYFDVGWYIDITLWDYDKDYEVIRN